MNTQTQIVSQDENYFFGDPVLNGDLPEYNQSLKEVLIRNYTHHQLFNIGFGRRGTQFSVGQLVGWSEKYADEIDRLLLAHEYDESLIEELEPIIKSFLAVGILARKITGGAA